MKCFRWRYESLKNIWKMWQWDFQLHTKQICNFVIFWICAYFMLQLISIYFSCFKRYEMLQIIFRIYWKVKKWFKNKWKFLLRGSPSHFRSWTNSMYFKKWNFLICIIQMQVQSLIKIHMQIRIELQKHVNKLIEIPIQILI